MSVADGIATTSQPVSVLVGADGWVASGTPVPSDAVRPLYACTAAPTRSESPSASHTAPITRTSTKTSNPFRTPTTSNTLSSTPSLTDTPTSSLTPPPPSSTRSPSVTATPSVSTPPEVALTISVNYPNTANPAAYTEGDFRRGMLALKCDFARIGGVLAASTAVTSLSSTASVTIYLGDDAMLNSANESSCTALMKTYGGSSTTLRRLAASPGSTTAGGRNLARAASVDTLVIVSLRLRVTTDAPAVHNTAATDNAVHKVADAIRAAVLAGTNSTNAHFRLSTAVWSAASNLTTEEWGSLQLFSVDSIEQYGYVAGTMQSGLDYIYIITVAVPAGGGALILIIAFIAITRRRNRRRKAASAKDSETSAVATKTEIAATVDDKMGGVDVTAAEIKKSKVDFTPAEASKGDAAIEVA